MMILIKTDDVGHWVKIGILGVLISFICGAGFYALTLPWRGTADSPLHLDYIWQVYKGDLPEFWEGSQAPFKSHSPVQFVSQHPPLYYALIAPFAGPSLDSTDSSQFNRGVKVARILTIAMGAMSVLAFAWAGWVFGGKRKHILAVALPSIAISLPPFIKVSGDVMNDNLVVLFTTLSLTLSVLIIKRGVNSLYILMAVAISLFGMASRATFISALALSFLAIYWGVIRHEKGSLIFKIIKASLINLMIFTVILIGIGWFFLRNYRSSGQWHRSGPQEWAMLYQNRSYRSLSQVLKDYTLWTALPTRLFGNPWSNLWSFFSYTINSVLSFILFASALISNFIRLKDLKQKRLNIDNVAVVLILLLQFVFVFYSIISHAVGYGAINIRYFLAAWLPISLFLTFGLMQLPKNFGRYALSLAIIISWISVLINSAWYISSQKRYSSIPADSIWDRMMRVSNDLNGISNLVIYLLIAGIAVGIILQIISIQRLFNLTNQKV